MNLIDKNVNFILSLPIVGSTIPLGVGLSFEKKIRNKKELVVIYLGDAATEQGIFYESLNFAKLQNLKCLFVVENNFYSVYTNIKDRRGSNNLDELENILKIKTYREDGNKVLNIINTTNSAINYIKKFSKPAIIIMNTYRYLEHCGPNNDDYLKYRKKTEIEYWNKKFKIKTFIFRDPVFSINRKHTIEFCEKLINRNLKVKFIIETHLRILDSELIKILKNAGLKGVKVGVESGDEEVLKDANRFTIKKDAQLEKIRELEKFKILVSSMFIIGFPADDEKSIMKTINYAKKLNTTYSQFSVWTPYPGTPVFKEYEDKILAEKFEEFDQYNLVFKHKIFSQKKIRELLGKSYSMYYGRINWFLKFFKNFLLA